MAAEEPELVARSLEGDDAAFQVLYRGHAGRVKAYFLRSGFAGADADDLVQDVFIRVFKSLHAFDASRGTFAQWSAVIARNVARRHYPRRTDPEQFDPQLADEVFSGPENPGQSPETREEVDALAGCIESLPPVPARLVRLRYVDGRTTRGVAAAAGIPEATARLRLQEAMGLLETCLKEKGVFG